MMKKLLKTLVSQVMLCVVLIFTSGFSSHLAAAPAEFIFEQYGTEQGLGNLMVLQVLQDRQGYIWAATQDGLYRFDGYQFKAFRHRPGDASSLAGNYIQSLYEDSNGVLWVAIWHGGFAQYHPATETFTSYRHDPEDSNSLSNDEVFTIAEDKQGYLLIGTMGGGLNLFDKSNNAFSHFRHNPQDPDSLSGDDIYTVLADSQGFFWVGTRNAGLNRFDRQTETFTRYYYDPDNPNSLSHNKVYTLLEDTKGTLWVGTRGGGLNRFDRQTNLFQRYQHDVNNSDSLSSDQVWSIFEDKVGIIWVGTQAGGLNRFDQRNGYFERYKHNSYNNLANNWVVSVAQDQTGLIWLGVFGGGLSKFDPKSERFGLVRYDNTDASSLNQGAINTIFKDTSGILWIGTTSGLSSYDATTDHFSHYQHDTNNPDSLSHNAVRVIFEDSVGTLWVGTDLNGLNRFNRQNGRFTHYKNQLNDVHSLSDNRVLAIHEDSAGNLWVGTNKGLNRFNRQADTFTRYTYQQTSVTSISHNYILTLFTAQDNTLWVGTFGGGLNQYNSQSDSFVRYSHNPDNSNSLSHNTVSSIYQDVHDIFWIGTNGGLNRFDPISKKFNHYREKEGLSNDNVQVVFGDKNGQLWLGLADGISLFDPVSATIINHIGAQAGCTADVQGVYFKATDGQLFFGGDNGYCHFYPQDIIQPSVSPAVVLSDFRLLNKIVPVASKSVPSPLTRVINQTDALTLTHEDNILSFEFAALHYVNPSRNQFQYKLEGFQRDWIATAADNRRATFTNLPAGDYTFKVKASNNEGVWNEQAREVKLTIKPAPWRTWWAYLFYILLIALIFGSMVAVYLRAQRQKIKDQQALNLKLQQIDKLKDQFLANTSHELRTPLNGIIGLAESLMDGVAGQLPSKANHNLAMVVSSGKRLANLVNDILDFSKLKNQNLSINARPVDLHSLTEVVLTLSKPLLNNKKLELINAVPTHLPAALADENRLQQILHNLVGNAIKFTDAGKITVSAVAIDDRLTFSVTDTGIGIKQSQFATIFDSFEQLDGETERASSGTGLGLSVSKQLVELHGGTLSVESVVGQGSSFSFSLPLAEQKAPDSCGISQTVSRLHLLAEDDLVLEATINSGAKFRILLVDDEPINRQVLLNHLSLQNYQLIEASGGEQALQIIDKQGPFDLVLLDIMMPKVSGYEVCVKLRETYPANDLPVIFLTAKNQVADMVQSFAVGANDYLSKPVSKHELLIRVETHLKFLDIHRNLEGKVSERTIELEQKNREIIATQQQLVQSEKMASLGTLTAGVAHEINNPTNFVHVSSQNLEVDLERFQQFLFDLVGEEADEEILDSFRQRFAPLYEHLNTIKNGTERIKIIVQDLRTFTQLDSAEQKTVSITDLLQSTVNLVKTQHIEITDFIIDFAVCPELNCYPAQLNQVFMNLIVNACDAIKTRQQKVPGRGQIFIGCHLTEDAIEVSFRDNGCGMSDETQTKLFEPFYTTKDVGEGTGLGLSISHGIVKKHGGRLSVGSGSQGGATLLVRLPL